MSLTEKELHVIASYLIDDVDLEDFWNLVNQKGFKLAEMDILFKKLDKIAEQGVQKRMGFGDAISALKAGKRVERAGWNGKSMWLMLIQGSNKLASVHGFGFGEMLGEPIFCSAIFMRTTKNTLSPWNASQEDVLAEDWQIVD